MKSFAIFLPGGCYVTLCGPGDPHGQHFRRAGEWAVEQAFASHEFEVPPGSGLYQFTDSQDAPAEFLELGFDVPAPNQLTVSIYETIYETDGPDAVTKVSVRHPSTGLWV